MSFVPRSEYGWGPTRIPGTLAMKGTEPPSFAAAICLNPDKECGSTRRNMSVAALSTSARRRPSHTFQAKVVNFMTRTI